MLYVVRIVAASGQTLGYLHRGRVVRLATCTIYHAPSAAKVANDRLAAPGEIVLYKTARLADAHEPSNVAIKRLP